MASTINEVTFSINDRIRLDNGRTGIVRWKGLFEDHKGVEHVGIEMDVDDANAGTGRKHGHDYFICALNRGVFVLSSEIIENLGNCEENYEIPKFGQAGKNVKIGDKVEVLFAGVGTIKYIGKTALDGDNEMIGLELDKYSPNYSDGRVRNEQLFDVDQSGFGYIVKPEHIIRMIDDTTDKKSDGSSQLMEKLRPNPIKIPKINDRCRLIDGSTGVVRFVGNTEFGDGRYIGLSLDSFCHNAGDGAAKGKKYFRATPGKGFFVKLEDLVHNLGSIIDTPIKLNDNSDEKSSKSLLFKVGDTVKLRDGSTGIVKFIGIVEDGKNEAIGLELDKWSANGGDGRLKGKKYFAAAPGTGEFVERKDIISLALSKSSNVQHLDILPDKGDRVRLKDGDIGLVTFVEWSSRPENKREIQVQIVIANNNNSNNDEKKTQVPLMRSVTLIDILENLGRDFSQLGPASQELLDSLKIGDHVRLIRGKTGRIRYIGPLGEQEEVIGIELDSWSVSAHSGKGKFRAAPGHGYFCRRGDISARIGKPGKTDQERLQTKRHRHIRKLKTKLRKIETWESRRDRGLTLNAQQENLITEKSEFERQLHDLQEAFNRNKPQVEIDEIVKREPTNKNILEIEDITIDDRVTLDSDENGKIVFIGDVHYDDREMIGIVLDEFSPNGHDGSVDGKVYFVCENGYGLLIPVTSIVKLDKNKVEEKESEIIQFNDASFGANNIRVGDEISIGNKKGVVKYIGTPKNMLDETIGIELKSWHPNAGDGTLNGESLFKAQKGRGYFIRKQSFASLNEMIESSAAEHILRKDSVDIPDISQLLPVNFDKGDQVRLDDGQTGFVRYIGVPEWADGDEFVGLELTKFNPNGHTGSVLDEVYFEAKDGFGFFCELPGVVARMDSKAPSFGGLGGKSANPPKNVNTAIKFDVGSRVRLDNGRNGVVRYLGQVDFGEPSENKDFVGIELDSWHYNATSGTISSRTYFHCRPGYGYFARKHNIIKVLPNVHKNSKKYSRLWSLKEYPNIEDRVKTVRGKTGIVKYVGMTDFSKDRLIGIALDSWNPNGTDGTVNGKSYFECEKGHGYFSRLQHLIENLGPKTATQPQSHETIIDVEEDEDELKDDNQDILIEDLPEIKFKLGDRVKLSHGKTGVVRYIGNPDFTSDHEEVVGLELDSWDANASDGTIQGKKLFDSAPGRAYFTRRRSVANIMASSITEGSYARLKGLEKVPQFNGKTVKVVSYVPNKLRWKVKILHNSTERKYLGVREQNLDPILDWEAARNANVEPLKQFPSIGDRVKTKNGKWGVVKYIGTTKFSNNEKLVGLELNQWNANAHDGKVKGVRYFTVKEGRGYFTKLDQLVKNRGKAPIKAHPGFEVKIGDRVTLDSDEIGKIVFIGDVHYDDHEMIGIIMDELSPNGHDGSVGGKVYFNCQNGYGLLIPITRIIKVDKRTVNQNRDLFIKYFQNKQEIDDLFQDCSLETNIWQNSEYSEMCDKYRSHHGDLSIFAMIQGEQKKMNSFTKRCKKGVQTIWNSFRRSMSFLDLFTDIRLLYLVSIADPPIIPFIIVLSVSLVCPYIVSYSCGVKLFHINRDNNYDIKNFTQSNSFDGYVALKKIVAYLSLSPVGVLYFLFLDLIDILFVYYKLFAIIFFGKNEIEMKLLEEMVAKQLGMSRMDYEGIKRQRATSQLSLAIFVCFAVVFCYLIVLLWL